MGNQLAIGNLKLNKLLDDDLVYHGEPVDYVELPTNTDTKPSVIYLQNKEIDLGAGIEAGLTGAPDTSSFENLPGQAISTGLALTGAILTPVWLGGPIAGLLAVIKRMAGAPSAPDSSTAVDQYWSIAELMTYNLEGALKTRWSSVGSKAMMNGLSMVKNLVTMWEGVSYFLGLGSSEAQATTEGSSEASEGTETSDWTTPIEGLSPGATLPGEPNALGCVDSSGWGQPSSGDINAVKPEIQDIWKSAKQAFPNASWISGLRQTYIDSSATGGKEGVKSQHWYGKALDIGGTGASMLGIAKFLVANAAQWGVKTVIFNGKIWSSSSGKWSVYSGDNKHIDHVHVNI